ncbi:hypothetical protein BJY52DRAFT_1184095 [Lactarius psammicola]|nr:hypothetical protein BJY52DRAFT_1184095 [Lactarius psammicola]
MVVKHKWNVVLANWESLGHPPVGTIIGLHVALKPHRGSALTDGLYGGPGGRGVSDIAVQALNLLVALSGYQHSTSLDANARTLAAHPLAFLNPWLYSSGLAGLDDIMSSSDPGCNTVGLSAIPGWDPVTGLGMPDFFGLEEILDDWIY